MASAFLSASAGDDLSGIPAQLDDLEGDSATHRFGVLGHINYAATCGWQKVHRGKKSSGPGG
jgi:hypothetical protein